MPFLKVDSEKNINIFYEIKKNDHPPACWVTLINGHMRTTKDFIFLSRKLVENGFSVLSFDTRSSGQSLCEEDFSLHDIKEDCLALWHDINIKKTHIVCFSMGGLVSQLLVEEHPEKIDHLILISTCFRKKDLYVPSEAWPENFEEIKLRLLNYFSKKFQEKNMLLIEAMAKNFLKEIKESYFNQRASAQRRAIGSFDETQLNKCLLPNIHIFHGKKDQIASIETVYFGQERFPSAQIHWYEEAGHLLLAEEGQRLMGDILNILIQSKI